MRCPPGLSGSENYSPSIGKGSPLEVSSGMMLSLIIASDVSKRAEEEGVVQVNKFILCFNPLVRHACAFCGFVVAMSRIFDSSFFCSALLPSRNLLHVSWVPMTEPSTLVPSVICTFDPANVSSARSIFYFLTLTWHFGSLTKYPYRGTSVFRALNVSYTSDIRPHAFPSSAYPFWITFTFGVFCMRGRSQLHTCTLQAGYLAWYLLLTIVLFRSHKAAIGMNMSFLPH